MTLEEKAKEIIKESYYIDRCLHSGCPYLHIDNRNCTKFGGYFTSVSNKNCPMMKNLNANIKLTKAKEIIQKAVFQNICYNCDFGINHCNQCRNGTLRKQAEQFLKEIDK